MVRIEGLDSKSRPKDFGSARDFNDERNDGADSGCGASPSNIPRSSLVTRKGRCFVGTVFLSTAAPAGTLPDLGQRPSPSLSCSGTVDCPFRFRQIGGRVPPGQYTGNKENDHDYRSLGVVP
jgi:hypothetical protein